MRSKTENYGIIYGEKILNDAGKNGSSWILRRNFERYMKSVGHLKCLQVKTGTPAGAKQSTMDQSISLGTLKQHGVKAITSLLKTELHIG